MEKLRRVKKGRRFAGVCGGLAKSVGIDVSYIRLAWMAAVIVPPYDHYIAVGAYILLAVLLPEEKKYKELFDGEKI